MSVFVMLAQASAFLTPYTCSLNLFKASSYDTSVWFQLEVLLPLCKAAELPHAIDVWASCSQNLTKVREFCVHAVESTVHV